MKTSFKSMTLIGAALASVLVCYTISLKVSAERAAVEQTRTRMVGDLADIRMLQAELRTRSRLPELQRWNEQVLALAPPKAEQFLGSAVMLANYAAPPAAAPAVEVAAIDRTPVATPMAAPSPVRTVAYSVPAKTAPAEPAARVAKAKTVVAAAATHEETQHEARGLDAALAAAINASASTDRPGFQKIALR